MAAMASVSCNECAGLGETQDMEVRQFGRFVMQWSPCDICHGSGKSSVAA
jgi:DnaJ-class molecular chaperone